MIKLPGMRNELIDYLRGLSDHEYQKECWVEGKCPEGVVFDELDLAVHFLFDDTILADDPYSLIGDILDNDREAREIELLCRELDDIFKEYGNEERDCFYIGLNEWHRVLLAASRTLSVMNSRQNE